MNNKRSIGSALGFIVIVLIVGLGAYYAGVRNGGNTFITQPGNQNSTSTNQTSSTTAQQIPTKEEVKAWKTYTYGGMVLKYPSDWKAEAGFYYTPAGSGGQDSVVFSPSNIDIRNGSIDRVDFGGHQTSCDSLGSDYTCKTINNMPLYTKSKDPGVLRTLNAIAYYASGLDDLGVKTYLNSSLGYQINYLKDMTIKTGEYPAAPGSGVKGTIFEFPKSSYQGGTISEARVGVVTTKTACSASADSNPWQNVAEQVMRNGQLFEKRKMTDAAAGNYYAVTEYNITRNSQCYRIGLLVHGSNPGNTYNDKTSIDAANRLNAELQANMEKVADDMVGTFVFTK
jgi:hypothetical protein